MNVYTDSCEKLLKEEWFDHIVRSPGFEKLKLRFAVFGATYKENGSKSKSKFATYPPNELKTSHLRHVVVEEDEGVLFARVFEVIVSSLSIEKRVWYRAEAPYNPFDHEVYHFRIIGKKDFKTFIQLCWS